MSNVVGPDVGGVVAGNVCKGAFQWRFREEGSIRPPGHGFPGVTNRLGHMEPKPLWEPL